MSEVAQKELRILILTPRGRDAALAKETLDHNGLSGFVCHDGNELRHEIHKGAGCVLIAEEALPRGEAGSWADWFNPEPDWFLMPLIVLLSRGNSTMRDPLFRQIEQRPNVNFIERPTPRRTLVRALRTAIEARLLQYAVRDALQALQSSSRRKDEFLAILSHELRNPLVPIRNAIYVLKKLDLGDPACGAHLQKVLPMAERQVDYLRHLVDDLLEVSRITTGRIVLREADLELGEVLRQSIELSEPLIKAEHHELCVDIPDGRLPIVGDEVRLTQVFANLLNNATKYTRPGGRIELEARRDGDAAVIRVRDNGVGIVADMLPNVFELFTQSALVANLAQGGLGIGLALVRNLVELHGGKVEARSDGAGCGSEFTVRLPLAVPPEARMTAEESARC